MRLLALIPGRGGSKRLPRKNVLPFRGRPMIAWTVEAAVDSGLFESVIVTTDDDEIAAAGAAAGADVLRRPAELGRDDVRLPAVTRHALNQRPGYEAFCLMLPNCPLRTCADIGASHRQFTNSDDRSAILSVLAYGWCPPAWALREDGRYLQPIDPDEKLMGPRDSLWCPSGAVFWTRTEDFVAEPTLYPKKLSGFVMPWHRALDIDTQVDYEAALCVAHAVERGFVFSDRSTTSPNQNQCNQ